MNDEQIIEYLRTRGRIAPPHDLVEGVMVAVDAAPRSASRFAALLPAVAAAGAIAAVVAAVLLLGPGRDVGPSPSGSAEPSAPAETATLEELEVAVMAATERLASADAVHGLQTHEIEGYVAAATWFDWRPSGDQVIVYRSDIDVSVPWWTDPDGAPLTVGERIREQIDVIVEDAWYRSDASAWTVMDRADAPPALAWGPGLLSGEIRPLAGLSPESDAVVTRRQAVDGVETWNLSAASGRWSVVWIIDADGVLTEYVLEDADGTLAELEFAGAATRSVIEFTAVAGADAIPVPDPAAEPDATRLGIPADVPLDPGRAAVDIDYRVYVEEALAVLETYHWNSDAIDWTAARSAALDGLPDDPTADQAHARIQRAIQTFDVFRTAFIRPQDVPDGDGGGSLDPIDAPTAERVGDIGLVTVPPGPTGGVDTLADYLAMAHTSMADVEASAPACGWVVDLRDHAAGAWGPPIWTLSGLLGPGKAVSFTADDANWALEVGADGLVSVRGIDAPPAIEPTYVDLSFQAAPDDGVLEAVRGERPYVPEVRDAPVAVLVGPGTASGGEQAVVAFLGRPDTRIFGGPTAGQPIVAPNLPMADGARLRMPIWIPADRQGTPYRGNITPDELIGDTRPTGSDAVRDAAVEWLERQPGCS